MKMQFVAKIMLKLFFLLLIIQLEVNTLHLNSKKYSSSSNSQLEKNKGI